jgi:galactokinase
MAVTVDILLAVKVHPTAGPSTITISNVNTKFPKRTFEVPISGDIEIDASSLEWSNYFKAGLKGAVGLLKQKYGEYKPVSMEILANGTVPSGGGLSSSAAFVCASALAVLRASGEEEIGKKELTELAIVSERSVGVNSGGYAAISTIGRRHILTHSQHGSICLGLWTARQRALRLLQAYTRGNTRHLPRDGRRDHVRGCAKLRSSG